MEVKICVGSACYVKGSHDVIEALQRLIDSAKLQDEVTLKAAFCLGHCTEAVSLQIDDTIFGVSKESVEEFFNKEIRGRIR
ncbi:MAG: NAD(P)H-dependent oxidoreductase subunit E [Cellulosilyticaceae bacterium]